MEQTYLTKQIAITCFRWTLDTEVEGSDDIAGEIKPIDQPQHHEQEGTESVCVCVNTNKLTVPAELFSKSKRHNLIVNFVQTPEVV